MTKRNIRTPEQIILDTEAKLAKLRERQMKQEAANDPDLLPLLAEKEAIQKDIREAKKILGTGPQSAEARIAKHQAWIEKIEIQREEAHDTLGVADQALSEVNSRIQKMIQTKADSASN
jgi:capsule polysaccharide export protein KpsE/RkpR